MRLVSRSWNSARGRFAKGSSCADWTGSPAPDTRLRLPSRLMEAETSSPDKPHKGLRASQAKVGLSTASVYPENTAAAFELAAKLGYDGVEVMVWTDPTSQDPYALLRLSQHYQVPILAIHAPCLIITQRVWGTDPWIKLQRAQFAAELLGAQTVVVHPPFRWQRDYARGFQQGIAQMANETDVRFAVENMFPLRVRGREVSAYQPTWD